METPIRNLVKLEILAANDVELIEGLMCWEMKLENLLQLDSTNMMSQTQSMVAMLMKDTSPTMSLFALKWCNLLQKKIMIYENKKLNSSYLVQNFHMEAFG
jgi:hypothetical protein